MNKLSHYSLIGILLVVFSAFQLKRITTNSEFTKTHEASIINTTIQQDWETDAQKLIETLNQMIAEDTNSLSLYLKSRFYLKRMEPLWEFIEKEKYNSKINAAPLLKPEPGSIDQTIIEPEGFQVIDELITGKTSKSEIDKLCHKLIREIKRSKPYIKQFPFRDYAFFESFYLSLNRLYNLGISNFDTPGTESQFSDAVVLMNYWKTVYKNYYKQSISEKYPKESKRLDILISELILELKTPETISFIDILKNTILPLQAELKNIQSDSGVEFLDELSPLISPVNTRASHFMDTTFLNTAFFSGIKRDVLSDDLIKLGKILFNDPILSSNNKRACASCHNPKLAFADGMAKSQNFNRDGVIKRNSPGLINAVFAKDFFHDLRAESLQSQADHVVNNSDEFNSDFKSIGEKLLQSESYVQMFKALFGNQKYSITKHTITKSIAAYISSLQSFNSPFDLYVRNVSDEFPEDAKAGYNLFMTKGACATCHFAPTFAGLLPPFYNDTESEILGVWETFDTINPQLDPDLGRGVNGKIRTELDIYMRSFKTVTLRNINETGPYMHHGNFTTLEDVMHFYNQGGGDGVNLTVPFQTLSSDKLNLSQKEISQLISFLKQLSDNPFKNDQPLSLPKFEKSDWNSRTWGGEY